MNVTPRQVVDAIKQRHFVPWSPRSCSICDTPLYYIFQYGVVDPLVFFDSGCDCSGRSNVQRESLAGLADFFNRQTDEVANRLWTSFIEGD